MPPKKTDVALTPDSPITALPGISKTRAEQFARLGILTLSDLVRHYPRRYEMRGRTTTVKAAVDGEVVSLILCVGTQPRVTTIRRGMVLTRFSAFDDTGSVTVTYFNQAYLKTAFSVGVTYRFWGRCERLSGGRLAMSSPKYEPLPLSDPGDGATLPPIYPIYKTTAKLTQKVIATAVARAMSVVYPPDADIPDPIPDDILHDYRLAGMHFAMQSIHLPKDESSLDAARRRIVFEELLLFSLGLKRRKYLREERTALPMHAVDMEPFYAVQPFSLTGAQRRAVREFISDMTEKNAPMNRLLSGDVGSGKTVCAAAALYIAMKNGYQAALMAPTEILATQHYEDLSVMFARLGFSCALLVGQTKPKEKADIKARLCAGELSLVIGTHALLEDNVIFKNCGLVITDEQHRFGVGQRAALAKKAENVHTLIMSATPIPRTLALMLFGDLDMSVLDEMPPGRQKVSTFCVDETYRDRLNGFIRRQVEEGHNVYIVCPAIEEAEEVFDEDGFPLDSTSGNCPTMKAAVAYAENLQKNVFPDLSVGFLHGKMKGAEKDAIMHRFAVGEIRILVSTTVIEVGVNVPSATLMVVENADHFGLSQLHQLRGRVGRGRDKSWCILVSETKNDTAKERLSVMCKTNNGYEIAERDLALRGPGDFFATNAGDGALDVRQSGGLSFAAASLCDDMALVRDAFGAAERVMEEDAELKTQKYAALRESLVRAMGEITL